MTESVFAPAQKEAGEPMCNQCDNLQKKISHYRDFLDRFDPLTDERIRAQIEELEQRKEAMHEAA
jgi:hypothetical protein